MKRNSVIIQFALCLVLTMFGLSFVNGQTYQLGDLYTFQDGSKGIVFYINPDNPTSGTVASLRDLDGTYALWTGSKPQSLSSSGGLSINKIKDWECHGKRNTQLLAASGVSPAANAIGDSFRDELNIIISDVNNCKKDNLANNFNDEYKINDFKKDDSLESDEEIKLNLNYNDDSIEKNIPKEQEEIINKLKQFNRPETSYGRQKK